MGRMGCRAGASISVAVAVVLWSAIAGAEAKTASAPANPVTHLPYIFGIAVDRSNPNNLLLATRAGLYRASPDGSAVRVSVSEDALWDLVPHPQIANVLYAIGIPEGGTKRGVIVSRDYGHTWRHLDQVKHRPRQFWRIDLDKTSSKTIYGLSHNLWVNLGGGGKWVRTGPLPDWGYDIAVSSLDAKRIYLATPGGLYTSTDGGRSWLPAFAGMCSQPITVVETGADGMLYAFSTCDGLIRANEHTGTWIVLNDDFGGCIIQHLAIDPTNSDRIYVVLGCNRILLSHDRGHSWKAFGSDQVSVPNCVSAQNYGADFYRRSWNQYAIAKW